MASAGAGAVTRSLRKSSRSWKPVDAARYIRDVRVTTISPGTVTGHASAGGGFPADVDFPQPGNFGLFRSRNRSWAETEVGTGTPTLLATLSSQGESIVI